MAALKQSTARTRAFLMVDSADHITGKTGLTVTLTLSKNGGAFGAAGGAVSEIGSGWYSVALNTTDTNTVGDLAAHATATGADPTDWSDEVSARILDDLSTLDAAAIRTAVGLASANLDTQLTAIAGYIDTEVAAILAAVDTEVAAIKAKTDQLTFTIANKLDSSIQLAADFAQGAADKVWLTATRALTDKVGFALSSAGVQAIWDAATSALTTVGSIGKLIVDNLNATITSVKALLPAALVGGRMDSSVGAMASGVITAAAHAPGAIDAAASASDFVNEIRDAITGAAVDGATTVAESLRLSNAALGGKSSGHATGAPIYRDLADVKNRITATTDTDGNRTAVTRDLT